MPPLRILILGAGFSRPAGLPLGRDLFRLILEHSRRMDGRDSAIERDLDEFRAYKLRCDGIDLDREDVDLEEFVSFLDIEYSLWLQGSDTLTEDGNRSQLAIRRHIGAILQSLTPKTMTSVPEVYHKFVSRLDSTDTIITFNYDILLERMLEHEGKSYRLFPARYRKVHPTFSEVDDRPDEILLLKLHGSVDWFYRREFDLCRDVLRATGHDTDPHSAVFGRRATHSVRPLVEGPRPQNEELSRIYRLTDPDAFYRDPGGWEAPYLLAPASTKALYASPLRELWNGLGKIGGLNFGLSIVGFSLPAHDEYLRQIIYRIARNFQYYEPNLTVDGRTKSKMALVDYRPTVRQVRELKARYGFLDWTRTDLYSKGLDEASLDLIFR